MDRPSLTLEQVEAEAVQWLARQESSTWSETEAAQFRTWLNASIDHRIEYLRIESTWKRTVKLKALGAGVTRGTVPERGAWGDTRYLEGAPTLSNNIGSGAARAGKRRVRFAALAASVLLAGLVGALWLPSGKRYTTQVGAVETVSLSDGSQVTLNTNTSIHVALNENSRGIELKKGEAYFDVAKDPARAFIVTAGRHTITAVGTAFSVRRLGDDVRVTVMEGKVRLDGGTEHESSLLAAGATAMATKIAVRVTRAPAPQIEKALSWRSGYISFDDVPLEQAVAEFNRYTEKRMVIDDPAIAPLRVGGNFRIGNTQAFLWMLQNGFPIAAEQREAAIVLRRR